MHRLNRAARPERALSSVVCGLEQQQSSVARYDSSSRSNADG
jgi:hypothetical protein